MKQKPIPYGEGRVIRFYKHDLGLLPVFYALPYIIEQIAEDNK